MARIVEFTAEERRAALLATQMPREESPRERMNRLGDEEALQFSDEEKGTVGYHELANGQIEYQAKAPAPVSLTSGNRKRIAQYLTTAPGGGLLVRVARPFLSAAEKLSVTFSDMNDGRGEQTFAFRPLELHAMVNNLGYAAANGNLLHSARLLFDRLNELSTPFENRTVLEVAQTDELLEVALSRWEREQLTAALERGRAPMTTRQEREASLSALRVLGYDLGPDLDDDDDEDEDKEV